MQVYCDLDQVIVNFLGGARRALGREFNDPALGTDQEKWALLRAIPNFWIQLEWMPGGKMLWKRIKEDAHILSAAPALEDAPSCPKEKRLWCWQELGVPDNRINIVRRDEKKNFAVIDGTINLLIDDHPKNVSEWVAAGGKAILHHTVPETLQQLDSFGL